MIGPSHRIRDRIRNIPLVKENDPRRWREVSLFLALLLVLSLPVLFDIAQQTKYVRTRYAIQALRAEKSRLEQQHLQLRIEQASLESLPLVSDRAGRALGLVRGTEGLRIFARSRATSRHTASPGAAPRPASTGQPRDGR
jgi:hypothetical protein